MLAAQTSPPLRLSPDLPHPHLPFPSPPFFLSPHLPSPSRSPTPLLCPPLTVSLLQTSPSACKLLEDLPAPPSLKSFSFSLSYFSTSFHSISLVSCPKPCKAVSLFFLCCYHIHPPVRPCTPPPVSGALGLLCGALGLGARSPPSSTGTPHSLGLSLTSQCLLPPACRRRAPPWCWPSSPSPPGTTWDCLRLHSWIAAPFLLRTSGGESGLQPAALSCFTCSHRV